MPDDDITPLGSGVLFERGELRGAVPGQEVLDAVDPVIGDVAQYIA